MSNFLIVYYALAVPGYKHSLNLGFCALSYGTCQKIFLLLLLFVCLLVCFLKRKLISKFLDVTPHVVLIKCIIKHSFEYDFPSYSLYCLYDYMWFKPIGCISEILVVHAERRNFVLMSDTEMNGNVVHSFLFTSRGSLSVS